LFPAEAVLSDEAGLNQNRIYRDHTPDYIILTTQLNLHMRHISSSTKITQMDV
jgi:hypothetical protein